MSELSEASIKIHESKPEDNDEILDEETEFVMFKVAEEEFGIDVKFVKEIIKMDVITRIPNSKLYLKGVINLRGGIVPIVDFAQRMGMDDIESDENHIMVLDINKKQIGLIVKSATEVVLLDKQNIKPAPAIITKKVKGEYISGVGLIDSRLIIILDLEIMFKDDQLIGTGQA
ncbi:chemotaxis protein CheW [Candidatus Woesearchaeota archaeon]|nr:chemotaxis protein CheW [Candidatus Woesearchaeota archaeon]